MDLLIQSTPSWLSVSFSGMSTVYGFNFWLAVDLQPYSKVKWPQFIRLLVDLSSHPSTKFSWNRASSLTRKKYTDTHRLTWSHKALVKFRKRVRSCAWRLSSWCKCLTHDSIEDELERINEIAALTVLCHGLFHTPG